MTTGIDWSGFTGGGLVGTGVGDGTGGWL